jgi:tetratricopeptide (TPR) repeat protein
MHGESNTWGAYQCYGDPSFSLFVGEQTREQEKFVSPNELAIWLERQASIARREGLAPAALLTALTSREQNTPAEWWRSASVCALAGKAYAEIGQFEAAIDYYTRALGAEPASAPISTVEQLANCRVRLAGELIGAQTPDLTRAAALLDDAERDLELLLKIGKTAERYSLLGGVYKRRAMIPGQTNEQRKKALKDMSRAYKHAVTQVGVNGSGQTYPFANQLAAEVVLSWPKDGTDLSDSLAMLQQLANADVGARTDTFSLSALADLKILTALADRDVDPASWSGVAECMAGVLSRGAGARVRESMRTQLRFFRVLAESEFPETGRQAVIARLEELEETMISDNP